MVDHCATTAEVADEQRSASPGVPPVGEQIHLPGPSYLPVVVAFVVSAFVVGVVVSPVIAVAAAIAFVIATVRWARQARAELASLPLEH
jgi:Flp pilus assembly protein TadB